jgi:hypothetical protein
MPKLLLMLFALTAAFPAVSQSRVCRQVGNSVQCSDGSASHGSGSTQYEAVPPKPGSAKPKDGFEYYSDGKVCQTVGKVRTCK